MQDKIAQWVSKHPYWMLTLIAFAALFSFLTKPFNMDDPLFIWAARQIQSHPGNPYDFTVNWYGHEQPMWMVTENPPLTSYYIAVMAGVLGWSEISLHLAFLIPAIAAVLGTYRLAKSFCTRPFFAALLALFTPVFLVSSTTIMCDIPLLAFWVWAVVFWVEGMEQEDWRSLTAAGILASLAFLTKYYGLCLIPLLAAYGLLQKRGWGKWVLPLMIPLGTMAAYEWATHMLYGKALVSTAASYAVHTKGWLDILDKAISFVPLAFMGGCMATAIIFAPLLWRPRTLLLFLAGAILAAAGYHENGTLLQRFPSLNPDNRWAVEIQAILWAGGGISILALAAVEVVRLRDAKAWLLALWILGTFAFTALMNWSVNGRSILPMAPALAILIARFLERKNPVFLPMSKALVAICAVLALLVTSADFSLATSECNGAEQVCATYGSDPGTVLWFEGHWGFQYYMQLLNGKPLNWAKPEIPGRHNLLLVPTENCNVFLPDEKSATLLDVFTNASPQCLITWNFQAGAGFYANVGGPLPFAFGKVEPEKILVYGIKPSGP
jgi:4-amino-4-deoxy-L-arabinose transferase-like glycosyltransferase